MLDRYIDVKTGLYLKWLLFIEDHLRCNRDSSLCSRNMNNVWFVLYKQQIKQRRFVWIFVVVWWLLITVKSIYFLSEETIQFIIQSIKWIIAIFKQQLIAKTKKEHSWNKNKLQDSFFLNYYYFSCPSEFMPLWFYLHGPSGS